MRYPFPRLREVPGVRRTRIPVPVPLMAAWFTFVHTRQKEELTLVPAFARTQTKRNETTSVRKATSTRLRVKKEPRQQHTRFGTFVTCPYSPPSPFRFVQYAFILLDCALRAAEDMPPRRLFVTVGVLASALFGGRPLLFVGP